MTDLLQETGASERPRMDPRFARRWIDARREEGRQRLRLVMIAGALVALMLLAAGVLYSPLLNVRHVRIAVEGPLSSQSIASLAGVSNRTRMITVDGSSIAARLDSDPWLGQARVDRHWPATVSISVVVRDPVAAVAVARGWAEIDPTGRVLAVIATPPVGLPVLEGLPHVPDPGRWIVGSPGPAMSPTAGAARLVDMNAASDGADVPGRTAAALAVLAALPDATRGEVLSVDAATGPDLTLVVAAPGTAAAEGSGAGGTITVRMGDGSQLQAKVAALLTLLDEAHLTGVTGVDLTVPDRPATVTSKPPFGSAGKAPDPTAGGGAG